jgi:hypothetical protein
MILGHPQQFTKKLGHVRVYRHTDRPRTVDKGRRRGQYSRMCGRFTLSANRANVAKALGIAEAVLPPMKPR